MSGRFERSAKSTARQVAESAGVSASTVDRVLNGRGGVRPDKERRVMEWARRLRLDRALDQRPLRTLRIAVLMQSSDNPFHAALRSALRHVGERLAPLNLCFFVHELDPVDVTGTATRIRRCGETHDGLIVICPNHPATAAAIGAIVPHRPVVTLATDVPGSGRHAFVGPDDRRAGRVAADLIGRLLGREGGEILMVAGLLSMTGQAERQAGFTEVLSARYPACRLAAVVESREDPVAAGLLVREALAAAPATRGLYNASAGARAVADAIRDAGRRNEIVVITHELTEDRRDLLRAGLIDAVIDQDAEQAVQVAVETLARVMGRLEGTVADVVTPLHIHMRENP